MAAALRMGAREWVLLIVLSMLWGSSFFFAAVAVKQVEPFTLAFLRMSLAALALAVVAAAMGVKLPKERPVWAGFVVLGAFGTAAPFSLLYWGQTQISGSLTSILNATTPLFTILIAHFATSDEKLSLRRVAGVLAGLAGVVVIIGPSALAGAEQSHLPAEAAVLAAALCYASVSIFSKRFRGVQPIVIACGQLVFGAILILPVTLIFGDPFGHPMPDAAGLAAIAGIALLSTALAFILYFRILAAAGATNVVLVTLLVPVSAIGLGSLILGEALAPRHFAGLALIACGLMVIDGRLIGVLRRWRGRPPTSSDASGLTRPPVLNDARNL
ncbi:MULTISPECIES: DMT family transporter [Rhodomicrobium]|uniref:DMT family transporter n=1 Tax=Rhodomicrobium TaxID=1068 RepID=UPI000B4B30EF|nr:MULTISPECIES: DMT family transporter [Rhodomicrobium]